MKKCPFIRPEVRLSVITLLELGHTYEEAAEHFDIGRATVNRIWRRYRETGEHTLPPRKGGRRAAIHPSEEKRFRTMILNHADSTYDELTLIWNKMMVRKTSRAVIVRMVKKLGFSLKKVLSSFAMPIKITHQ